MIELKNDKFCLTMNANGAVTALYLQNDPFHTNFILATEQEPWVPEEKQWGLGFLNAGHQRLQITDCVSMKVENNIVRAYYELLLSEPRFGCVWSGNRTESRITYRLELIVTRTLSEERIVEEFELINHGEQYVALDEIGLYSSFHHTYVMEDNALETHVNQHFWMGGDLSYIEAQRQSGNPPHVGLITTEGCFSSYQLEELNSSNHRGVIAMMCKDLRIRPGGFWKVSRILVPYEDRADFETKIRLATGYPEMDYGHLVVVHGEDFRFHIRNRGELKGISINGFPMQEDGDDLVFTPENVGEYQGRVYFGNGKIGTLRLRVIEPIDYLLHKRAHFIAEKQQVCDKADFRYGAYMPYDNLKEKIVFMEDIDWLYFGIPDRNEARERLGMGAFLAAYSRIYKDDSLIPSLLRYADYVERCLIDENYDVWDSGEQQGGLRYYMEYMKNMTPYDADMRRRSFNVVFVLAFEAEMYWLTRNKYYARICAGMMERYAEKYRIGGNTCMFGVDTGTIRVLIDAGMQDVAERMLQYLKERVYYLREIDDKYDPSEVIYEQGTTASAMREIADYYLTVHDDSLLEILEKEKIRTMAFEGRQPDYRCYHAPVIHWDAFWFGSLEIWGDTMPHYWDTISADAYCMYAKITGQREMAEVADYIFRNNLALIEPNGSCWNCYIYPEKVNGRPAGRLEPWANDQDWAFYTYLKAKELLSGVW